MLYSKFKIVLLILIRIAIQHNNMLLLVTTALQYYSGRTYPNYSKPVSSLYAQNCVPMPRLILLVPGRPGELRDHDDGPPRGEAGGAGGAAHDVARGLARLRDAARDGGGARQPRQGGRGGGKLWPGLLPGTFLLRPSERSGYNRPWNLIHLVSRYSSNFKSRVHYCLILTVMENEAMTEM